MGVINCSRPEPQAPQTLMQGSHGTETWGHAAEVARRRARPRQDRLGRNPASHCRAALPLPPRREQHPVSDGSLLFMPQGNKYRRARRLFGYPTVWNKCPQPAQAERAVCAPRPPLQTGPWLPWTTGAACPGRGAQWGAYPGCQVREETGNSLWSGHLSKRSCRHPHRAESVQEKPGLASHEDTDFVCTEVSVRRPSAESPRDASLDSALPLSCGSLVDAFHGDLVQRVLLWERLLNPSSNGSTGK